MKILKQDYIAMRNELIKNDREINYHIKKGFFINNCRFINNAKITIIIHHKNVYGEINHCCFESKGSHFLLEVKIRYLSMIRRYKFKTKNSKRNRIRRTR